MKIRYWPAKKFTQIIKSPFLRKIFTKAEEKERGDKEKECKKNKKSRVARGRRDNNFGKNRNFPVGTFAYKIENYLLENAELNPDTGCSKFIDVSLLPHELTFTGNGSKLRKGCAFKKKYEIEYKKNGKKITHFRCCGWHTETNIFNQYIRKDIKDYYSRQPSAWSGLTSEIEVDHKNGRKNDFRLNDPKKQTFDDFQSLTKAENDFKRQKCIECMATNKRPSASEKNAPFAYLGVDYIEGDSNYNESIGCRGCYLYDVEKFKKEALRINKNNK